MSHPTSTTLNAHALFLCHPSHRAGGLPVPETRYRAIGGRAGAPSGAGSSLPPNLPPPLGPTGWSTGCLIWSTGASCAAVERARGEGDRGGRGGKGGEGAKGGRGGNAASCATRGP
eukprot:scaffold55264_cov52-Phaeocystis_antarctica.AAC.4